MQKLAEICVRRPVFATMIILSLTVVGLFSYKSLGVDLFPKIDLPTITVTVVNPGSSPQEVETEITDKVEGTVNTISGIDDGELVGGRTREVEIWVRPDNLRAYSVTVAAVANAVRMQNMEVPGGRVDEGVRELTVRTMGRIVEPADFNNLVVANRGTYSVKLSDVGYAEDGFE